MSDLTVIVGGGYLPDQEAILVALDRNGFNAVPVKPHYPRGLHVYHKGRYFLQRNYEAYADGGFVQCGTDFMLWSDDAIRNKKDLKPWETPVDASALRRMQKTELQEIYPERIYVLPTGTFSSLRHHTSTTGQTVAVLRHLDYFALLLPMRRRLIIDTRAGKEAIDDPDFLSALEEAGLQPLFYEPDDIYHPLNDLVLPKGDTDIVFYDAAAKKLARILDGLNVESVPISICNNPVGKIHCKTNEIRTSDIACLDRLLAD